MTAKSRESISKSISRASVVVVLTALLAGCELTPEGGSLYHASAEIGNTYALEWPRRVYACDVALTNCFQREVGSFTVDNAAITIREHIALIRLVFDDGRAGWMVYNEFLKQQFAAPATTRLIAKVGMTADQIRSSWGEPERVGPAPSGDPAVEEWSYPAIGLLYFEKGKLVELALSKSLLAVK